MTGTNQLAGLQCTFRAKKTALRARCMNSCLGAAFALFLVVPTVSAQEPLHQRIDRAIAAATPDYAKKAAAISSDAEFLRRVTLDLTGTIPTSDVARKFLKDPSPAKRQALVDRLLASPEYAWHMSDVFDVYFMERRLDFSSLGTKWKEYLRASFAANKSWDQLTREILANDGTDDATYPAMLFYLNREMQMDVLTRDIGRMFLGMNLQCAQCHDHPLYSDYTQEDYYGLYAFINRMVTFADPVKKVTVMGEKAEGDITFVDVFDKTKKTNTGIPHLPGFPITKEPVVEKGKEYLVAATATTRPVPRYSRRSLLFPKITDPSYPAYRRNIANRLWALMMGRGLIHPLDENHADNPPSHPELLNLLADDLAAHKFDMRYFFRELALSRTYQLSSETPPGGKEDPTRFTVANFKALSPEEMAWTLFQATGQPESLRKAQGAAATDEVIRKNLVANLVAFLPIFTSGTGTPPRFHARADHALFVTNGSPLRVWILPAPGNTTNRLLAMKTSDEVADEMYLSVLTRMPDEEERKGVKDHLASVPEADRTWAIQELTWSLLASAEFRFNH